MKKLALSIITLLMLGMFSLSIACSAKNDVGDTCETNCSAGQVASCSNGVGANKPECKCEDSYKFSQEFNALQQNQQDAIKKILVKNKLLTEAGTVPMLSENDIPEKTKNALNKAMKDSNIIQPEGMFDFIKPRCLAARAAAAIAVGACATVPGGQIVIAVCIAATHELANEACK